ncbi:MAG: DUF421 domain-containing protein [Actinomycetota bacterium]|nr:DUF421 domain-containing protein [Actinomycetota bacterium]
MHTLFHIDLPSIFRLGEGFVPTILEKVLRAGTIYIFLVTALRISGKRELAQLSPLDFVVLLAVANAVQNGIIGKDNSVTGGITGAITLFVLNYTIGRFTFMSKQFRHFVLGSPSDLIQNGEIDENEMRRNQMTRDDLLVAVERANASSISDVETCTLLPSGNFVVKLKPERQRQTLEDINKKLDTLLAAQG